LLLVVLLVTALSMNQRVPDPARRAISPLPAHEPARSGPRPDEAVSNAILPNAKIIKVSLSIYRFDPDTPPLLPFGGFPHPPRPGLFPLNLDIPACRALPLDRLDPDDDLTLPCLRALADAAGRHPTARRVYLLQVDPAGRTGARLESLRDDLDDLLRSPDPVDALTAADAWTSMQAFLGPTPPEVERALRERGVWTAEHALSARSFDAQRLAVEGDTEALAVAMGALVAQLDDTCAGWTSDGPTTDRRWHPCTMATDLVHWWAARAESSSTAPPSFQTCMQPHLHLVPPGPARWRIVGAAGARACVEGPHATCDALRACLDTHAPDATEVVVELFDPAPWYTETDTTSWPP
jgi:hypothetical protein